MSAHESNKYYFDVKSSVKSIASQYLIPLTRETKFEIAQDFCILQTNRSNGTNFTPRIVLNLYRKEYSIIGYIKFNDKTIYIGLKKEDALHLAEHKRTCFMWIYIYAQLLQLQHQAKCSKHNATDAIYFLKIPFAFI